MHLAVITAGGAGMFCGSCLQDNALARAWRAGGMEVSLIPTYTPLTLDTEDESAAGPAGGKVFLGGVNLYLEHKSKLWDRLPGFVHRAMDSAAVLKLSAKLGVSNDAADLGPLTVDLLRGEEGPQRRGIGELVDWVTKLNPDAVLFSNALLVGPLRELRKRYRGPVWCTLQGDDIFLNGLREPHRSAALAMICDRAGDPQTGFTGFLAHSTYYADHMAELLGLDRDRFRVVPLLFDAAGVENVEERAEKKKADAPFTAGYFARICPEKGLHDLVTAFQVFHDRRPASRLVVGGYLGPRDRRFWKKVRRDAAPLGDAFVHAGSPADAAAKHALLSTFDVLSVPTTYREPKGLPVLEAWAHGVPCVQPAHGAFPELLGRVPGGVLVPPGDPLALADALTELHDDPAKRHALGEAGRVGVREVHAPAAVVGRVRAVLTGAADGEGASPHDGAETRGVSPGGGAV